MATKTTRVRTASQSSTATNGASVASQTKNSDTTREVTA